MSTEFTIWRVSERLIQDFERFGKDAFDTFWLCDFIEDIKDKQKIDEALRERYLEYLPEILGDSFALILQEVSILGSYQSGEDCTILDTGGFLFGIDFLLCGSLRMDRDFIVKKVACDNLCQITVVNALEGTKQLVDSAEISATYLVNNDIQEAILGLRQVLEDNFAWRWETFQKMYPSSYYNRPFAESFSDVRDVRRFIEDDLLKIFTSAVEANQGILLTRCS